MNSRTIKQERTASAWRLRVYRRNQWRRDPSCRWCHKPIGSFREATVDHVIPLSKGGSNSPDNWLLSCFTCNHSRGDSIGAPKHVLKQAKREQEARARIQ